jgi:hypothetical protein
VTLWDRRKARKEQALQDQLAEIRAAFEFDNFLKSSEGVELLASYQAQLEQIDPRHRDQFEHDYWTEVKKQLAEDSEDFLFRFEMETREEYDLDPLRLQ